jgi:hypothetical protein
LRGRNHTIPVVWALSTQSCNSGTRKESFMTKLSGERIFNNLSRDQSNATALNHSHSDRS